MLTCPSCGAENPGGFRFCGACAAPLAPTEASSAREERKVVTVLFADLVGFTSRSEQLDPEDVRAILAGYHERLRAELERFGGTVEKFIGDAVMALFGAPTAHEDDPERAIRAAFAVRDAVSELGDRSAGSELHVRVGITTGEALVDLSSRPELGEGMAAGDVVNTAARLQSAAPTDGVLVDERTYRATDRTIVYRPADPLTAKGKSEPIPVWEAVEPRSRLGADVARDKRAPLVGREREVEVLRGALARMLGERTAQLMTLIGVPGIGKSRLVQDLFEAVEAETELVFWRQGRSLPYGAGVSFWALGDMVKAHAGVLETDTDDVAADKLSSVIATLVADDEEARWVERHLRPLVGLAGNGQSERGEAFAAWRRFLEALAETGPTVLVFEDLHWADEGLLDFVVELVDWAGAVPLLVVCTARPELLTRRPGWGGGTPNATTLSLAPLSDDHTARLLASLLDQSVIPAELQTALLQRAGGNPLYAEEFVRMVGERGANTADLLALPESLQGIIAARLDGLGREDKALLQDAAVVGKVFWLGAATAVGGLGREEAERRLHELERRQIVRRERRSSVAGETEYAFWHVLVRDVAYGQIPRAQRADRHRRAAGWIGSLSSERVKDRADLLAHHYLAALELSRAAGTEDETLRSEARDALATAGARAGELNAFGTAIRYYREALALSTDDDPMRASLLFGLGRALFEAETAGETELAEARDLFQEQGDLERAAEAESLLGGVAWHAGRVAASVRHRMHAMELVAERPPSRQKALVLTDLSRQLMLGDRWDEAIGIGQEALAMAESLGLEDLRAAALNTIGVSRVVGREDLDGMRDLEKSIQIAESRGDPEVIRGYLNLASVVAGLGDVRRCEELHRRGMEFAQRFGKAASIRFLSAELVLDAHFLGRWDEVVPKADAFLTDVETAGSTVYMEGAVRSVRASILLARDETGPALTDVELTVAHARKILEPQTLLPALSHGAHLYAELGDDVRAMSLLDELLASMQRPDVWLFPAIFALDRLHRLDDLTLGPANRTKSRWIDAGRLYVAGRRGEAADVLEEIGSLPDAAFARLRDAEELTRAGHHAEASAASAKTLDFYRSVGAKRFIRRAERLLAASA